MSLKTPGIEDILGAVVEAEFLWSARTGKTIRLHKVVFDIQKVFKYFGYLPPEGIKDLVKKTKGL